MERDNKKTDWDNILIPVGFGLAVILGVALKSGSIQKMDFFQERETIKLTEVIAKRSNSNLDLLIVNGSYNSFKDVKINCDFIAKSGTILKNKGFTLYELFPKRTTQAVNNFTVKEMPAQTVSVLCEANGIEIIYPPKSNSPIKRRFQK